MAGRGPAPKDPSKRRRPNSGQQNRSINADGRVRGPRLPPAAEVLGDEEQWHPRTLKWWDTWRRSPQAKEFSATDWDFLLDTALMHNAMWSKGRWEFAAELRLRTAKFGATPEDRKRLGMDVEAPGKKKSTAIPPASDAGGSVTSIASRRARLTG